MAFQTAITRSPAAGVEGMIADGRHVDGRSCIAKTTLAPGRAVRGDAGDAYEIVSVPDSAAEVTGDATHQPVMGVTMWSNVASTNPYVAGDPVTVLKKARVFVLCEDVMNPSLPVYIRHTANGGDTTVGGFRASAATGASLAPPGFRWITPTTAVYGLAVLEVNLP